MGKKIYWILLFLLQSIIVAAGIVVFFRWLSTGEKADMNIFLVGFLTISGLKQAPQSIKEFIKLRNANGEYPIGKGWIMWEKIDLIGSILIPIIFGALYTQTFIKLIITGEATTMMYVGEVGAIIYIAAGIANLVSFIKSRKKNTEV